MNQNNNNNYYNDKALHPRNDIDRLYVSRKKEGRGLANIEDSVDTSIRRLEDYIKKQRKANYSDKKQHKQSQD